MCSKKSGKGVMFLLITLTVLSLLSACGPAATPQVVEKEVVVEKPVVQTVVVEKEKVVEKPVVQTVVVEKEIQVPVTPTASACKEDVYVVTAPLVHPFLNVGEAAAYDAGEDLGVKVLYYTPTEFNMPKQLEMTESALSIPCVVGLGVIAADPSMFTEVEKQAMAMGIKVVQQSGCAPETPTSTCFMGDLTATFVGLMEKLADTMGGKGNVVVATGPPDNANHQKMVAGIEEGLAKYPDIKILDILRDCDETQGTVTCAETALARYPEMNAYVGAGALTAVGAAQTFPEAGREDIIITGTDDDPVILDGIKKGTIAFSFAQQKYGLGYWLVYIPYKMHTTGKDPAVKFIDTRYAIVDKSNVDNYMDTIKQNFEEVTKYIDTEVFK
jgi:ribose transport system substrate-binding protein